jgi:transcriptional regulator with XRE-family HTH domain
MSKPSTPDIKCLIRNVNRSLRRRLAVKVRALRKAARMTQKDAAERSAMDERHWQKIEAAEVNVTMATMVRMANTLHVDLPELFAATEQDECEGEPP